MSTTLKPSPIPTQIPPPITDPSTHTNTTYPNPNPPARARRPSTRHSSQSATSIHSSLSTPASLTRRPQSRSTEQAITSSSSSSAEDNDPTSAPSVKIQTQGKPPPNINPTPSIPTRRRIAPVPAPVRITPDDASAFASGVSVSRPRSDVASSEARARARVRGDGLRNRGKDKPDSLTGGGNLSSSVPETRRRPQTASWSWFWSPPWNWKPILPHHHHRSTRKPNSDGAGAPPPPPEIQLLLTPKSHNPPIAPPALPEDLLVKITYSCKHILPQRVTHTRVAGGGAGAEDASASASTYAYHSPQGSAFPPWPASPWSRERKAAVYASARKDRLRIIHATSRRLCANCLLQRRRWSEAFDLFIGFVVLFGTLIFLVPFTYPSSSAASSGSGLWSLWKDREIGWFPLHTVWRNPLDHFYMPWSLGGWNGEWDQYGYYGYLFGDYGPPSREGQYELHRYGVKQPRLGSMWGPAEGDDPYDKWERLRKARSEREWKKKGMRDKDI
ncbi:hypothetical protein ACMFMG_011224 [Clarireedia jacksonii]